MPVSLPNEPVYYYECSGGKFRLVYFIPPTELERLRDLKALSQRAIDDFPDGVDLDCTEPDFREFEELYSFRPDLPPDALRRAFFAMFSSTRDWEQFQGSGFVPARDLERYLEMVDDALRDRNLIPESSEAPPDQPTLEQRRRSMGRRTAQQAQIRKVLEQVRVEGVDPERTLRDQKFTEIPMGEGWTAEEVFGRLYRKGRR